MSTLSFKQFIQETYQIDQLWDFFGGVSNNDIMTGGMYPGMSGKNAVKNMVLDTYVEDPETEASGSVLTNDNDFNTLLVMNAIDTLQDEQLLKLIMKNYEGVPMKELPDNVQEFSTENERFSPDPLTVNISHQALLQAIKYYKGDGMKNLKIPEWAQDRLDKLQLRRVLIDINRKKIK